MESLRTVLTGVAWERLRFLDSPPAPEALSGLADEVAVFDPVRGSRHVEPGCPGPRDAAAALATLDAGIDLVRSGSAAALVTGPVSKASIARHCDPGFRGHTDYLARACGLERYGRDYLMAFLTDDLQVALLTVHLPLRQALDAVTTDAVEEALALLDRVAGGRLGVAGLNPHAGEEGLLGTEDRDVLAPAVARARARGIDARGPASPDSVFARARRGDLDWVLALYHDQGLIAVKTAASGPATNWTLGLPFLRTSVDHGTAFQVAGQDRADVRPLASVVETTLQLLSGTLPRHTTAA